MIQFTVVAITVRANCLDVELEAKAHPIFRSLIFLHLPAEELSKFSIGQIYSLTARGDAEFIDSGVTLDDDEIETVPLGRAMDSHPTADDTWGEI